MKIVIISLLICSMLNLNREQLEGKCIEIISTNIDEEYSIINLTRESEDKFIIEAFKEKHKQSLIIKSIDSKDIKEYIKIGTKIRIGLLDGVKYIIIQNDVEGFAGRISLRRYKVCI